MTTSSSYNFILNRSEIIQKALEEIAAVDLAGTVSPELNDFSAVHLNLMLKNWAGQGLNLWRIRETTLLLEADKVEYTLDGSTSHWVFEADLTETYINGDQTVSGAATTITLDSTSGMSASDVIGVELEDGSIQFTTVATVDSSTTCTPDDSWTDDIDDDDVVYYYTNKAPRPLHLVDAWRRSPSTPSTGAQGSDTSVKILSSERYHRLGSKRDEGAPIEVYYDPQVGTDPSAPSSTLKVYPEPDDVAERLIFKAAYPFEDMDVDSDNVSAPSEWLLPIVLGLALRLCNSQGVGIERRKQVKEDYVEALLNAWSVDHEHSDEGVMIVPDPEGYYQTR